MEHDVQGDHAKGTDIRDARYPEVHGKVVGYGLFTVGGMTFWGYAVQRQDRKPGDWLYIPGKRAEVRHA